MGEKVQRPIFTRLFSRGMRPINVSTLQILFTMQTLVPMRIKRGLYITLGILVLIQLIRIDQKNPPVDPAVDFGPVVQPPAEVLALFKSACYDCHSSETQYPWYSNVAPVSWWVKHHINEGREHFDFSSLGQFKGKQLADILADAADVIAEGEMPLSSYTWMHPEARLSAEQRKRLVRWMRGEE